MSYYPKSDCGGVRTLADLRGRCILDAPEDGTCWHLRQADGKPLPTDKRHVLWSPEDGKHVTATRLAWRLGRPDKPLREGWRVWRCCSSYDCVNPEHLKHGSSQAEAQWRKRQNKPVSQKFMEGCRRSAAARCLLTPELRQWLLESSQNHTEAAHALGISRRRAQQLRARQAQQQLSRPAASIFDLATRAGWGRRRAA